MSPSTRIRLSILFFVQFFIWGTWGVSMGTWMTKLGFSSTQIGTAFGATSVAAMISPFFVGMIADRFFAAQRVLGALHIVGGALLYAASRSDSFPSFYPLLLAHTLCYMPTLALVNAVAFSQMESSAKSFGGIRVMGTFGWIAAGLLIGMQNLGPESAQFEIGAAASVALGLFCFVGLPHVPPRAKGEPVKVSTVLGLDALQLLKDRSFAVFAIGSFLICIPLAFYYSGAERFLTQVGVTEAPAKMTYGQMSEVFFMFVFPLMFARLGVKKMLLLGMFCWSLRYVLFAYGDAGPGLWMLLFGIILHGACFDFFFVTGQVYVDQQADPRIRAAAQGFIAFITYGAGMLVGSLAQGFILERFTGADGVIRWSETWLIPAAGAALVLVAFAIFFKDPGLQRPVATEELPATTSPEGP